MKYDYRQFKFDIDMIRNELNDSEITPPANLPEVLINESNDVSRKKLTYLPRYTNQLLN